MKKILALVIICTLALVGSTAHATSLKKGHPSPRPVHDIQGEVLGISTQTSTFGSLASIFEAIRGLFIK